MTIAGVRRYDDYRDSGSEWIGEVPSLWKVGRLKDFVVANPTFRIPKNFVDETLIEFVPMTNVDEELGAIRKLDMVPYAEVASGYKRFQNGDVIFAKITPCMENGNCAVVSGLSQNIGFGSTEFLVYRPKGCLSSGFLHYFLHNDLFRKNAVSFMKGSAGQKRLPGDYVETHVLPLPSLAEQQAIAAYLDARTAQIDRRIDLLTQKAERYRQLKRSLITAAVTRGLDRSVPMKESGIAWAGEVPSHWSIRRIKDLAFLQSGDSITADQIEDSGPYPVYGGNGIRGYTTSYTNDGDHVLIGRQGALCGNINFALGRFWASEHAVVAYPKGAMHTKWFGEILRVMNLNRYSLSAAQPGLSMERIEQLLLPVPPYDDQRAIADYIDFRTAQIDEVLDTMSIQVDKLKELRKALINDVVTGKLRVT